MKLPSQAKLQKYWLPAALVCLWCAVLIPIIITSLRTDRERSELAFAQRALAMAQKNLERDAESALESATITILSRDFGSMHAPYDRDPARAERITKRIAKATEWVATIEDAKVRGHFERWIAYYRKELAERLKDLETGATEARNARRAWRDAEEAVLMKTLPRTPTPTCRMTDGPPLTIYSRQICDDEPEPKA